MPPTSACLRHHLRRNLQAWKDIGTSPKVLDWIRRGVRIPFRRRPSPFHQGDSLLGLDAVAQCWWEKERARLRTIGALEDGRRSDYVSRAFLVPKPGCTPENPKFRLVFDLRHLNSHVRKQGMRCETLKMLRHLAPGNSHMISFDISDGFYCIGVAEEDRDYFTVSIQGELLRFAALPMGYTRSPLIFCQLMSQLVRHLRAPSMGQGMSRPQRHQALRHLSSKRQRRRPWRGVTLLQYVDDWLILGKNARELRATRDWIFTLLRRLGLPLHPDKGVHEPTQKLVHLGLEVDLRRGEFRAPEEKLSKIARLAKDLLYTSRKQKRVVPMKRLASLAGQCQFLYLAIPPARFYLRELHDLMVGRDNWNGTVKLSNQLRRDLEWWVDVPKQHNGRPICRPVETAYLATDASDYGWGATLNNHLEARGFWTQTERGLHITHKELQAVRHAVQSFLPQLRGRRVVLDGDNQAVIHILTHLTSRSPTLMTELRKLWFLLDSEDIRLRSRWISTHANIWADRLSRELDTGDWQFNPRIFRHINKMWGGQTGHAIDRFASATNALLPRFNSRWNCPGAEAVDSLSLSDQHWRKHLNWCNPPWRLLHDLVTKLHTSGAAATVVAPLWPSAMWYQQLKAMSTEVRIYPPARDLFLPGQVGGRAVGSPTWSTAVFRVPLRPSAALPGLRGGG